MILRKVIRRNFLTNKYCRPNEGCTEHVLECGHSVICKQSCGDPARKQCLECERAERETRRDDHTFEANDNSFGDS